MPQDALGAELILLYKIPKLLLFKATVICPNMNPTQPCYANPKQPCYIGLTEHYYGRCGTRRARDDDEEEELANEEGEVVEGEERVRMLQVCDYP